MRKTVSEQAKLRAYELLAAEDRSDFWQVCTYEQAQSSPAFRAFARYIQQVSDAAKAALDTPGIGSVALKSLEERLSPHILSDPVDPLLIEAEVLAKQWNGEAGNFALLCLKRGIELAAPRSKEER